MMMTGFSLFGLIFGTAHSINYLTSISCYFNEEGIILAFYILAMALCIPVFFVLFARRVTKWANDYSKENVTELEELLKGEAKQAALKSATPTN